MRRAAVQALGAVSENGNHEVVVHLGASGGSDMNRLGLLDLVVGEQAKSALLLCLEAFPGAQASDIRYD